MTRKDYIKLAAALAYTRPDEDNRTPERVWSDVVDIIGDVLKKDNPRFDRGRFIDAASVDRAAAIATLDR